MLPAAFAGAALDRANDRRDDIAWLAAQEADPAARAVVVLPDGAALDGDRLARLPLDGVSPDRVLLGVGADGPLYAAAAGDAPGASVVGLRDAVAVLAHEEAGLAGYAAGLLNWHRSHGHCARCGAASEAAGGGHVRRCPACGAVHHPRTDPVVIMLVTDGARVLLGRQARWPAGRYSVLAGFVEPGETLEEAVAREVREEAGVEISAPRYVASQPWPFPGSLMLGFVADHAAGEPSVRDRELEDVRWFSRAEVRDARAGRAPVHVPPPEAIARRLIDHWIETEA